MSPEMTVPEIGATRRARLSLLEQRDGGVGLFGALLGDGGFGELCLPAGLVGPGKRGRGCGFVRWSQCDLLGGQGREDGLTGLDALIDAYADGLDEACRTAQARPDAGPGRGARVHDDQGEHGPADPGVGRQWRARANRRSTGRVASRRRGVTSSQSTRRPATSWSRNGRSASRSTSRTSPRVPRAQRSRVAAMGPECSARRRRAMTGCSGSRGQHPCPDRSTLPSR